MVGTILADYQPERICMTLELKGIWILGALRAFGPRTLGPLGPGP